ncbi:translocase of outer mitochondrial membrane [Coelomomyces lativittatus]|nr:translocase of outer mitochondrial membrane [Coelomomyces lativittatus]KAJ1516805.1 translocase of outer mitochondrial membrane [Coelomomyces lativittatus]KAJ1518770.1 translocase of outer mitochondrial membrane [Coelomomyces lativittatus]
MFFDWTKPFSTKLDDYKSKLKLSNPGKFEDLHKKAQNAFVSHQFFDGLKVDFAKSLSQNFQINHSFQLGSQAGPNTYSFGAVFVDDRVLLHGMMDSDYNLNGRFNYQLSKNLFLRSQLQLHQQQNMFHLESEYLGPDYTFNVKTLNPGIQDGSGIYIASYLQSLTHQLALGVECVYQKSMGFSESSLALVGKYTFPRFQLQVTELNPATDLIPEQPTQDPVLTFTYQTFGSLHCSYLHPISNKVELASEWHAMCNAKSRESVLSVGAKYEFKHSTFKTMLDSQGKITSLLEQKLAPGISFLLSGELDHLKGASKFGYGLQFEM